VQEGNLERECRSTRKKERIKEKKRIKKENRRKKKKKDKKIMEILKTNFSDIFMLCT